MDNILHIYGQHCWHNEVFIAGDKEALQRLVDATNQAISVGTGRCQSSVNDGEGFDVYIRYIDDPQTLDKLALPYTSDAAKEKDKSAIWPWVL